MPKINQSRKKLWRRHSVILSLRLLQLLNSRLLLETRSLLDLWPKPNTKVKKPQLALQLYQTQRNSQRYLFDRPTHHKDLKLLCHHGNDRTCRFNRPKLGKACLAIVWKTIIGCIRAECLSLFQYQCPYKALPKVPPGSQSLPRQHPLRKTQTTFALQPLLLQQSS